MNLTDYLASPSAVKDVRALLAIPHRAAQEHADPEQRLTIAVNGTRIEARPETVRDVERALAEQEVAS